MVEGEGCGIIISSAPPGGVGGEREYSVQYEDSLSAIQVITLSDGMALVVPFVVVFAHSGACLFRIFRVIVCA